jgi:hypothetical protein
MPVKQMIIINKEGVETNVADNYALQPGEVKKEVPPASVDIDYEKEFNALLEENAKLASDRDNYKAGMLAAKGKLPAALNTEDLDLDTLIETKVKDTLLRTKEFQNEQAKKDLINKVIRENKELKLALGNKDGISRVAAGGGSGPEEKPVSAWTPEQIAYFQKRGLSPDKVKDNYAKFKSKSV